MSCGISHRCGSDPALLGLWHRPAATALIWPLAWELPYASGAALKRKKKKMRKEVTYNINYGKTQHKTKGKTDLEAMTFQAISTFSS